MIAAGIAAAIGVTITQLNNNAIKVSKTVEANLEIDSFTRLVTQILSKRDNCESTLGIEQPVCTQFVSGNCVTWSTPPTITVGMNVNSINRVVQGTSQVAFESSTESNPKIYGQGSFFITNMRTLSSPQGLQFVMTIQKRSPMASGVKVVTKKIPINANIVSGNQIKSCSSESEISDELLCEKSNGYFHNGKCFRGNLGFCTQVSAWDHNGTVSCPAVQGWSVCFSGCGADTNAYHVRHIEAIHNGNSDLHQCCYLPKDSTKTTAVTTSPMDAWHSFTGCQGVGDYSAHSIVGVLSGQGNHSSCLFMPSNAIPSSP